MTCCKIGQILRERNRPFSQSVLRLSINQPGPEALNWVIPKSGHLPSPDPLDTNSSRAHAKWFGVRTPTGKIGQAVFSVVTGDENPEMWYREDLEKFIAERKPE